MILRYYKKCVYVWQQIPVFRYSMAFVIYHKGCMLGSTNNMRPDTFFLFHSFLLTSCIGFRSTSRLKWGTRGVSAAAQLLIHRNMFTRWWPCALRWCNFGGSSGLSIVPSWFTHSLISQALCAHHLLSRLSPLLPHQMVGSCSELWGIAGSDMAGINPSLWRDNCSGANIWSVWRTIGCFDSGQLCCVACNRTFMTKFGFVSHIRVVGIIGSPSADS